MSIDFTKPECQDDSNAKLFGLCDDKPGERAYLDEVNGANWIAVVMNNNRYQVTFTGIDKCVIKDNEEKGRGRCDGSLSYNSTIVFIELKKSNELGNKWVVGGEEQLRSTISFFKENEYSEQFKQKRAYICNSEHPKFKESQQRRMEQFLADTGYVLRIENRIMLQ
ncbi:MAG TPA: hypothetical protein VK808_00920 [Bacteroidia bacterium]|jgi:hypothetical protein|nr:hypothetical protein [Bacteroidia bacterium]